MEVKETAATEAAAMEAAARAAEMEVANAQGRSMEEETVVVATAVG